MARYLKDRDEATFRSLYRAHMPAMYPLAMRFLGRRSEDAEEALQETWIRAMEGLPRFRWDSSLRTWLCGITINCCRELMRRSPPSTVLPEQSDNAATAFLFDADVESCVRSLPDGCREVLVLHDIEGYTHLEIGERLQISEGTSKSQLSRARAKMREMLRVHKEIS